MSEGQVDLPVDWARRIDKLPADGGPSGSAWLRRLPGLLAEVLERWSVQVTGPPMTGRTALVVPVRRDQIPLVVKVVWPHPETAAEHLALRAWAGRGAVRLVAAEPSSGALLLERLDPQRTLAHVPTDEACGVIGSLMSQLHVPAPASIPTVAEHLERHLPTLERGVAASGVPRRIVTRTLGLARELLAEPGVPRLLHGDLRVDNVLGGRVGAEDEWVAIDPQPLAGHPGFDLQPLLCSRFDELGTGSALRWAVRHRLELVADSSGIDDEQLRLWSLVRTGLQIGWAAAGGHVDRESRQIAIFKALDA